jgi:phosphohistidine phosphatase
MMNIVIWRHAEAEFKSISGLDHDRLLTEKGRADAHRIAKWLQKNLPRNTKIYTSPALRCLETVDELVKLNTQKIERNVQVVDVLNVESHASAIRQQLLQENEQKSILLVGHQPTLGDLVRDLLLVENQAAVAKQNLAPLPLVIKKGAVWWLRSKIKPQEGALNRQVFVLTVQHPDLI